MKKIYLLSCTFLLALTGCKEGNKQGSGSAEPSALTPQEAFLWIKEGNYTVDITVSYYDEGGEKDIIESRIKKDEMKFELMDLYASEGHQQYVTYKMYDYTLADRAYCYEIAKTLDEEEEDEKNIWYRERVEDDVDYLGEVLFQDEELETFVTGFENAKWDIDGYTYSGESELDENYVFKFEIKVNTSYIESIKVEFIDSRKGGEAAFHTDYEYAFSHVGETIVKLPVTVNDIYDAVDEMMDKLHDARSYELECVVESNIPDAPVGTYDVKVEIVGDEYHVSRETPDGVIVGRYEPETEDETATFTVYLPTDDGYTSEIVNRNQFYNNYFYGFNTPYELGSVNFSYTDPADEAYWLCAVPILTNERIALLEEGPETAITYIYKRNENGLPTEIVSQMSGRDTQGQVYYVDITISISHIGDTEVPMPHVAGNA